VTSSTFAVWLSLNSSKAGLVWFSVKWWRFIHLIHSSNSTRTFLQIWRKVYFLSRSLLLPSHRENYYFPPRHSQRSLRFSLKFLKIKRNSYSTEFYSRPRSVLTCWINHWCVGKTMSRLKWIRHSGNSEQYILTFVSGSEGRRRTRTFSLSWPLL
jgi:hypothetical protein